MRKMTKMRVKKEVDINKFTCSLADIVKHGEIGCDVGAKSQYYLSMEGGDTFEGAQVNGLPCDPSNIILTFHILEDE